MRKWRVVNGLKRVGGCMQRQLILTVEKSHGIATFPFCKIVKETKRVYHSIVFKSWCTIIITCII